VEVVGFCGSDAINVLVPMVTTDQATICDLFAIATVHFLLLLLSVMISLLVQCSYHSDNVISPL